MIRHVHISKVFDMSGSRRRVLSGMIGSLALGGHSSAWAALAGFSTVRKLSFENLHTGDRLNTTYWADGRYEAEAMREIAWVLRDHRVNEVHPIDPRLLDLLHTLGRSIGPRGFQVISGYRSPITNARLAAASEGVATHSLHTQGMAIDIRVERLRTSALRDAALALRGGGVGYYPRSDFVHVDVGRVRRW